MAFNMNKPVIKGTKAHSALLAKAEEVVDPRTHGVDPTLGAAAMAYGESNSPNVIDYNIKTRKIKWDKENQPKRGPKKPNRFNDWLKEKVTKAKTNIIDKINLLKGDTDDGTGGNGTNENGTDGSGTSGNGTNGNGTGGNGTGTTVIDGNGKDITNETFDRDDIEIAPIPTIPPGGEVSKEADIQQPDNRQAAMDADQARLRKSQLDLSIESKPYEYPEPKIDWDSLSEEEKEDPDVVPKRTRENIMKIHKDTDPNAVLAENDPKYKVQKELNMEGGTITGLTSPGPYTHSENEEENYKWVEEGGYKGYIYIDENGHRHAINPVNVPEKVRVREQTKDGKINRIKTPSHIVTEDRFIKNTTRNKKKLEEDKEKQKTETETPQEELVPVVSENLQTSTPKDKLPARLRNEYDKLSTWNKSKFRKKHKKYQF